MNEFCYKPSTINHQLIVVGTNHKFSPIELREKLAFSKKRLKESLSFLKENSSLKGAVIISTCNRVEIYASVDEPAQGRGQIEDFIARYHELEKNIFSPYFYTYIDKEALEHLLCVTSGLDSLILGETQILGQVREAHLEAETCNFLDGFLREVFEIALSFAKRIHRETRISEGKVSVGSVAIDFIKERIGNITDKTILIIGMGKVTKLVLKYLEKDHPSVVFLSNRTFTKAKYFAKQIGAEAVRFTELKYFLPTADVVITATRSPHFIIRKETFIDQRPKTKDQRLLILDLAMPRDVDPRVKELENVELFSLEDLGVVIQRNRERKLKEAKKAKSIIKCEAEKIWSELTRLEPERVLLP